MARKRGAMLDAEISATTAVALRWGGAVKPLDLSATTPPCTTKNNPHPRKTPLRN